MMKYVRINVTDELKKAANGKETKVPVGILLYNSLRHYPTIQARIGDAFEITEDPRI